MEEKQLRMTNDIFVNKSGKGKKFKTGTYPKMKEGIKQTDNISSRHAKYPCQIVAEKEKRDSTVFQSPALGYSATLVHLLSVGRQVKGKRRGKQNNRPFLCFILKKIIRRRNRIKRTDRNFIDARRYADIMKKL